MDWMIASNDEWADSDELIHNVNSTTALSCICDIDAQYSRSMRHTDYRVAWLLDDQDYSHYFGYVEE